MAVLQVFRVTASSSSKASFILDQLLLLPLLLFLLLLLLPLPLPLHPLHPLLPQNQMHVQH